MAFGVLKYFALSAADEELVKEQGYRELCYYCEHLTSPHGHVYEEQELEAIVHELNADPVLHERKFPKNYAEWLTVGLQQRVFYAFPATHKEEQHPVIVKNYARFILYATPPASEDS